MYIFLSWHKYQNITNIVLKIYPCGICTKAWHKLFKTRLIKGISCNNHFQRFKRKYFKVLRFCGIDSSYLKTSAFNFEGLTVGIQISRSNDYFFKPLTVIYITNDQICSYRSFMCFIQNNIMICIIFKSFEKHSIRQVNSIFACELFVESYTIIWVSVLC